MKGVVPEEEFGAVNCFSILHEIRTPNFDQVDVDDADDYSWDGVGHRGVTINPVRYRNVINLVIIKLLKNVFYSIIVKSH